MKKSKEKDPKVCPLLTLRLKEESVEYCLKEQCAWWNYTDQECSITQLGWLNKS